MDPEKKPLRSATCWPAETQNKSMPIGGAREQIMAIVHRRWNVRKATQSNEIHPCNTSIEHLAKGKMPAHPKIAAAKRIRIGFLSSLGPSSSKRKTNST